MTQKVLLAEDDPFLIDIYTTKLANSGFDMAVAKTGDEVLSGLRERMPDILLLDIVLPGMSGWEVLSEIRKDPKFNDLKIIILSNLGQKNEVEKGLEMGAVGYLVKAHYTPTQIVEEIRKILG
ncbi:MAG: response regulator [Candidatus Paceibacterota bacterium]|jgi:DNA-binding response OmpR family regulator